MPDPLAERIRDLIKQGGTTQAEFAARIDMTPDKLSKSLAGTRRFTSFDLAVIADTCGVTVDWLLTGRTRPQPRVAARKSGGVDVEPSAVEEIADRYYTAHEVLTLLGHVRSLPVLPEVSPERLYKDQGAALARAVLGTLEKQGHCWTADELPVALEKAFGVDVAVTDLPRGLGGLAWQTDDFRLILVQRRDYRTRQRFTIAHECAHILCSDAQNVIAEPLAPTVGLHAAPDEIRANAFAANLLMPESFLRSATSQEMTSHEFAQLVVELQVSPSALAARFDSLRIGDPQARAEWRRMNTATCYEKLGRLDEYLAFERAATEERTPTRLINGLYRAYVQGDTTLRPLASLLRRDVDSLYAQFALAGAEESVQPPASGREYIP